MHLSPSFFNGILKAAQEAPLQGLLSSGLSGPALNTFRQNLPSAMQKLKELPAVNYRSLVPLASFKDRMAYTAAGNGKLIPQDVLRQKAEPTFLAGLHNISTNTTPTTQFTPAQASAFGNFFKDNPPAAQIFQHALTNQAPVTPSAQ